MADRVALRVTGSRDWTDYVPIPSALLLAISLTLGSMPRPVVDPRISAHLPLARAMARKFLPRMGGMLELDDLVNIGLVAIWKATPEFDEGRGIKFGAFARRCIALALKNQQLEIWTEQRRAWLEQNSIHPHGDDLGIDLVSAWPTPERAYLVFEIATAVIDAGNERDRGLLRMLCMGETLEDAGSDLGLSKERVRTIQQRAFRIVRRRVEQREARVIERTYKSTAIKTSFLDGCDREAHLQRDDVAPSRASRTGGQHG